MVYGRRTRRRRYGGRRRRMARHRKPRRAFRRRRFGRRGKGAGKAKFLTIRNLAPKTRLVKHNFRNFTIERPAVALVQDPVLWGIATVVRVNSVYDPDYSGTGTFNLSASLYEYMAKFYKHYRVLKTVVTYTFSQRTLLELNPVLPSDPAPAKLEFVIGTALQNSSANAGYTDWSNLVTDPRMKTTKMFLSTTYEVPFGRCKLRHVYKEKAWYGTTGDSTHESDIANNPSSFVGSFVYSGVKDLGFGLQSYPYINVETNVDMWVEWSQPFSIMNLPNDHQAVQVHD